MRSFAFLPACTVLGLLAVLAPFAGVTSAAHAASQIYTNEASFLAALQPGSSTENFTSAGNTSALSYSYSGSGLGYTVTAPGTTVFQAGTNISTTLPSPLVFTFTTGNVTAVGGNFFLVNSANEFQSGPVTATLSDGTTATITPTSTSTGTFLGFISPTAITSLTFSTPAGGAGGVGLYNAVDNLTVGTAVPGNTTAPEPGSLALLLSVAGVAGMVIRKRRGMR
jgi:hypothetical protein